MHASRNDFGVHMGLLEDDLHSSISHNFYDKTDSSPILASFTSIHESKFLKNKELQYHGTTTMAFQHRDAIIVCVDSKASMGNYVGSKTVKKVIPVSSHIIATMAGGAADCSFWIKWLSCEAKLAEWNYGTKLSVGSLAKLLARKLVEEGKGELSVGTMIAGYDRTGPALRYVDSQGVCVEGDMFCVGSGSIVAYSALDSLMHDQKQQDSESIADAKKKSKLDDLDVDQAVDAALWAVRQATVRDGFSGGFLNVFMVNVTGVHHIKRVDSRTLKLNLS